MDINSICMIPEAILVKCKRDPRLSEIFKDVNGGRMCHMFSLMINKTLTFSHNIQDIHDVYEKHKRAGIDIPQYEAYITALEETCADMGFKEVPEVIAEVISLIKKLKEHPDVCAKIMLQDIFSELDKPKLDIPKIKGILTRVMLIINERVCC